MTVRPLLGLAMLVLAPTVALAEDSHRGLFLRATPGTSFAATGTELADGTTLGLTGAGGSIGLTVGAAVVPNWIIGVEGFVNTVLSPTLVVDDMKSTSGDVSWNTFYLGATTSFYVMPLNLYVSGGIGAVIMTLEAPGLPPDQSETGGAFKLGVGKEWRIGPSFGLGVGLETLLGAIPDGADADKGWVVFGASLALSASYH